jgi:Uma2 family endonuclease
MEEGLRRHRFTVEQYHRMAEVGLLAPDARVELIEGEIIDMSPMGPSRHRFTVEEYHRMEEVGLLAPDARVELIGGEVIDMPPFGSRRGAAVDRLNGLLNRAVGDRAIVRCRGPVRLSDTSEPQADFILLVPREDFYEERAATAADTLLIVDVSESTPRYDRQINWFLFGRYGIPEYWIFDTQAKQLHGYRPADAKYGEVSWTDKPGVTPITLLPGVTVDLSSLASKTS